MFQTYDLARGALLYRGRLVDTRAIRRTALMTVEGERDDICAVGQTDEEIAAASRGVRGLLSFYGSTPSYRPVLDVEGWGELQPELNTRSKQGDWAGMSDLITDEILHTIAVVGTPQQVAAEIVRRFGAEADRVCLYFPGYPITDARIAETIAEIRSASAGVTTPRG